MWFMIFIPFSLSVLLSACPMGDEECKDPRKCDGFADYVDPAISAISGALDDQAGSLFAKKMRGRQQSLSDFF